MALNPEGCDCARGRPCCDKDRGVTHKIVLTRRGVLKQPYSGGTATNPEGYDGAKESNICDKDRGVTYKTVLTYAGEEKTERLSFPSVQPSVPK